MTVFFDLQSAQKIADQNQKSDPDWKYVAQKTPGGKAVVKVYDQNGAYVGTL